MYYNDDISLDDLDLGSSDNNEKIKKEEKDALAIFNEASDFEKNSPGNYVSTIKNVEVVETNWGETQISVEFDLSFHADVNSPKEWVNLTVDGDNVPKGKIGLSYSLAKGIYFAAMGKQMNSSEFEKKDTEKLTVNNGIFESLKRTIGKTITLEIIHKPTNKNEKGYFVNYRTSKFGDKDF